MLLFKKSWNNLYKKIREKNKEFTYIYDASDAGHIHNILVLTTFVK